MVRLMAKVLLLAGITLMSSSVTVAEESSLTADEHTMALWHFDEGKGQTLRDTSSYGNNGTLLNMDDSAWVKGKFGKGLHFDKIDDFILVKNSPSLNPSSEITLEVWIKPEDIVNFQDIFCKRWESDKNGYELQIKSTGKGGEGKICFTIGDGENIHTLLTPPQVVVLGKWQNIAATYDGKKMRIYVDGNEVASKEIGKVNIAPNNRDLFLGRYQSKAYHFKGIIDEVRISDVARTFSPLSMAVKPLIKGEYEVDKHTLFLCHYNQSVNADYARGNPVGREGYYKGKGLMKITSGKKGKFGEGLYTGNSEDELSLAYYTKDNIFAEEGTIEMWVKILHNPTDEGWGGPLFYLVGEAWNENTMRLYIGNGKVEFYLLMYKESGYHIVNAPILNWKKGEWHHIACTWSLLDGVLKLYIDGKLQGIHDYNGPFVWEKVPSLMHIGCSPYKHHRDRPDVIIDELRISDIARQEFGTIGRIEQEGIAKDVVPSAMFKFDFGTEKSPVCPGFSKVTKKSIFSDGKEYGFIKASSSLNEGDDITGDYLTRDYISGHNTFIVKLKNGIYQLWILEGRWIEGRSSFPAEKFKLWIGKEKIIDIDIPKYSPEWFKLYYANMNNQYHLGETIYDRYVKRRFKPKVVEIVVKNNKLELTFDGYIRAMMIFRKADADKVKKELILLDKQRAKQSYYIEAPHIEKNKLSETIRKKYKDYIIFHRPWMKRVYPNTIPESDGITTKINIFATRGEYEPATFSIYPLKDIGKVKVEVTDLRNKKGNIIPKNNLDLRIVKYIERRQNGPLGGERMTTTDAYQFPKYYKIEPRILMPWKSISMEKGLCRTFWIIVKVPINAKAGTYKGNITVCPENGKTSTISLNLKVYPITLVKPPLLYGMFYYGGGGYNPYGKNFSWDLMYKELVDMREHNMNLIQVPPLGMNTAVVENGRVTFNDKNLTKFLKLCLKAGFSKDTFIICSPSYLCAALGYGRIPGKKEPTEAFMKIYNKVVEGIHKICLKNGFTNCLIWTCDEKSQRGKEGFIFEKRLHKMLRDNPYLKDKKKVKVLVTDTGKGIYGILDEINYALISGGMMLPEENSRKGVNFGNYNIGHNRLIWGFYVFSFF